MKTEEIALSRVSENEANPRTITEANPRMQSRSSSLWGGKWLICILQTLHTMLAMVTKALLR
jgi:hypothetical protein